MRSTPSRRDMLAWSPGPVGSDIRNRRHLRFRKREIRLRVRCRRPEVLATSNGAGAIVRSTHELVQWKWFRCAAQGHRFESEFPAVGAQVWSGGGEVIERRHS